MSYSRAQMIGAFLEGSGINEAAAGDAQIVLRLATQYVDRLQLADTMKHPVSPMEDLRERAMSGLPRRLTSFRNEYTEKNGQILDEPLDIQLQRIREQLLKSQERELVLAKLMGGFIFRWMMMQGSGGPQGAGHVAWVESAVEQLNAVFPELTPEE